MPLALSTIWIAAARSLVMAASAAGMACAAQATAPASPEGGPALALSPPPVSGEPPSYAESDAEFAVQVTTDKLRYQQADVISVTLTNESSTFIYAPPSGCVSCTVVSLQRLEAGAWVTQGTCEVGATASRVLLGPNSVMISALIIEVDDNGKAPDLVPGDSMQSAVPEGQIEIQPSSEIRKPDDLTPVFPEGIINVRGLLYPALDRALTPGTYRVVFAFAVGAPAGLVEMVYSEPFHVVG